MTGKSYICTINAKANQMEKLVKQITKEIDEKYKTLFLDEEGNEYQTDWAEPRFENAGFELKAKSEFNNRNYTYKGKCKLLKVGVGNLFEERHIFLERQSKHRFYLNEEDFKTNFKAKAKVKPKAKSIVKEEAQPKATSKLKEVAKPKVKATSKAKAKTKPKAKETAVKKVKAIPKAKEAAKPKVKAKPKAK